MQSGRQQTINCTREPSAFILLSELIPRGSESLNSPRPVTQARTFLVSAECLCLSVPGISSLIRYILFDTLSLEGSRTFQHLLEPLHLSSNYDRHHNCFTDLLFTFWIVGPRSVRNAYLNVFAYNCRGTFSPFSLISRLKIPVWSQKNDGLEGAHLWRRCHWQG